MTRDMSFRLLDAAEDWDFFDLLHVHSLELAAWDVIEAVLDRCQRENKGVVVTLHDVNAMFETEGNTYQCKLTAVNERGVPMVTLTDGAAEQLLTTIGVNASPPEVIPHGYVVHPDDPRLRSPRRRDLRAGVTFLLYGGFRPNRAMYPACVNAGFGLPDSDRLRVLTRGISPIELRSNDEAARQTVDFAAKMRGRIELEIQPFPSDDDVVDFLLAGDVLVMPYLWGTHSGQMETAFDLGLVPVVSTVGFVREQWELHGGLVPEPIWLDWSDGNAYAYGSRLVEALLLARERVGATEYLLSEAFQEHRRDEHQRLLNRYGAIYEKALAR